MDEDLAIEGDRWAVGGKEGISFEDHPKAAGFGRDGWVDGAAERECEVGGIVGVEFESDLDSDIADEETARAFVKVDGGSEEAGQKSGQGGDGHQSARVLDEKWGGQVEILAPNTGARSSGNEVGFDRVVAKPEGRSGGLAADAAERIKKFEESDIFVAGSFENWKGVDGNRRVDGDMFFFGRWSCGEKRHGGEQKDEDGGDRVRRC